ncbi:helix-turn-helix domain-containing protein [Achromobacter marplatensis]|uniref:Helix-turn-helix domain-containing protein n=1 Tax=Achromobacter marplatensis TaxID=470868 RepID=A0AA42WDA9_9BURK|nr:helix-turn-helix transcriptional regulator [Achromobacter marplatensis]MDH2052328.1 helix-turn-helix domain-containing protein [Achromobacter marplatensis]
MQRTSAKTDDNHQLLALGHAIRARRKELDLSQEGLALRSGIDRSHMGRIERGERNLTVLNLIRLCSALDYKPSELMAAADL